MAAAQDTANTELPVTGGAVKCVNGKAKGFNCQNVDLLAFLPVAAIGIKEGMELGEMTGGTFYVNVVWGWTDSVTGREFALVGWVDGTAFVEVTDPVNPKYLGQLPSHRGGGVGRDVKTYKNHAFIVAETSSDHGMQVFDLTQLRDVKNPPVMFEETAYYDQLASAHTLALNAETGYAYAASLSAGGETCGGQLHMIDVRNPTKPTFAGCYAIEKAAGTHETVCVIYRGPDQKHVGRELCFNANGNNLEIGDVTDKQHPKKISAVTYPNVHFAHQGWLSQDQRYFFLDDEHDDGAGGIDKTRTIVFDMTDLDDPVVLTEFYGTTAATDHNLYVRGRYMYQGNYKAGLRVIDVADPKNLKEVGYFDTYPRNDEPGFGGAWMGYPFFKEDGVVAVSSMNQGLFLLRFHPPEGR